MGVKWQAAKRPDSLLIVLGGRTDRAEREVRALATALHRTFHELGEAVEVAHFDSGQGKPDWACRLGLKPVYRRRHGQVAPSSKYN